MTLIEVFPITPSMATTQTPPMSNIVPTAPSNHKPFQSHLSREAISVLSNLQTPDLHFHQDFKLYAFGGLLTPSWLHCLPILSGIQSSYILLFSEPVFSIQHQLWATKDGSGSTTIYGQCPFQPRLICQCPCQAFILQVSIISSSYYFYHHFYLFLREPTHTYSARRGKSTSDPTIWPQVIRPMANICLKNS